MTLLDHGRELLEEHGKLTLDVVSGHRHKGIRMINAIKKEFGTLTAFQKTLGYRSPSLPKETGIEDVVEKGRELLRKHGRLTTNIIQKGGLMPGVRRHFRLLGDFYNACGYVSGRVHNKRTILKKERPGRIPCLRCDDVFESYHIIKNRICPKCNMDNSDVASINGYYPLD